MGWRFSLNYVNAVAYLTVPNQRDPPRFTAHQLREFLGLLHGEYRERPPLISSDPGWIREISRVAENASTSFQHRDLEPDVWVGADLVAAALRELRALLSDYELYGLAVGTGNDERPLQAFAEHAAYSSRHRGLFLIPDFSMSKDVLEIFDPSPVSRKILSNPDSWPGMLFWVKTGEAAFAPLEKAPGLLQTIIEAGPGYRGAVARVLDDFDRSQNSSGVKRLLHLSDLHFGTKTALENQAYLSSHLKSQLSQFQRVVITGDLFDNPKEADALAFRNFRADLESSTGKDVIVVPGNHDQKVHGNSFLGFGRKSKELAKLEWQSLVVDDDLQCVFYCFDTSRDAQHFARGTISRSQMMEVSTAFETRLAARPALLKHLAVALVHHHPYSFKTGAQTPLQKGLRTMGLNEEYFLEMEGSKEFLSWCAGRRIPLILHGHKHVARHVRDLINWTHGKASEWREVVAVGCGTSLGAEGMPLSYNVLEWSPKSQKWTVSFFSDPGHGSGFEEVFVAMHSAFD